MIMKARNIQPKFRWHNISIRYNLLKGEHQESRGRQAVRGKKKVCARVGTLQIISNLFLKQPSALGQHLSLIFQMSRLSTFAVF